MSRLASTTYTERPWRIHEVAGDFTDRPGSTGGKAYLGYCGTHLGGPTQDLERISSVLTPQHLALSDVTTLDATHTGVIASGQRKNKGGGFTYTYSWILTCRVPAQGAVTCVQNQQLGMEWSAPVGT